MWPVRLSWFCVVFPSVVTNYLGQGALLIAQPESIENPYLISNEISIEINLIYFVKDFIVQFLDGHIGQWLS